MYKKNIKTSFIITCHNYGPFLKKCIESVLRQSLPAKEIIIIDDASNDETREVALAFKSKIKYYQVSFCSAQKSRNFGLRQSTGEYLVFFDADDYLHKDFLKIMQKEIEKDLDLFLVYSDRHCFGDSYLLKKHRMGKIVKTFDYNYDLLKYFSYIPLQSIIRRRQFYGFDENIKRGQDWDAWITFLKGNKKAKRIAEPLFFHRIHGKNLTFNTGLYKEFLKVLIKHNKLHKIPYLVIKSKLAHRQFIKNNR